MVSATVMMLTSNSSSPVLAYAAGVLAILLWPIRTNMRVLRRGIVLSLLCLSLVMKAPLEEQANPTVTPNPSKAPWYFMGLQELLEHMHPLLAGVVIPTILVLFLISLGIAEINRPGMAVTDRVDVAC